MEDDMTSLKSLTFTTLPKPGANPALDRRLKVIARLEEQKALLDNPTYTRTVRTSVTDSVSRRDIGSPCNWGCPNGADTRKRKGPPGASLMRLGADLESAAARSTALPAWAFRSARGGLYFCEQKPSPSPSVFSRASSAPPPCGFQEDLPRPVRK
jgi:hypothetical protein